MTTRLEAAILLMGAIGAIAVTPQPALAQACDEMRPWWRVTEAT
jgi:hypothetical protein